jgi:hypothetical protein
MSPLKIKYCRVKRAETEGGLFVDGVLENLNPIEY